MPPEGRHLFIIFNPMKQACTLIILLFFCSCIHLPQTGIRQRWDFSYCNAPVIDSLVQQYNDVPGVHPYQQIFVNSKLVLRDDETFDMVLFTNYVHGNWQYDEAKKQLFLLPVHSTKAVVFKVQDFTEGMLRLQLDSADFQHFGSLRNPKNARGGWFTDGDTISFTLEKDFEHFWKDADDPYSIANNAWRVKPGQPESPAQIKQRVVGHLKFFKLLFDDGYRNQRDFVTYNWFVSPLLPASNGIALKYYDNIQPGWNDCFYDSTQAKQGYALLQSAFSKKLEFPSKIENRYQQSSNMIDQLLKNMGE